MDPDPDAYVEALERANLELTVALELKERMLAMAAHDLRTPIATIIGLAELLARNGDRLDPAAVASTVTAIARQARHLDHLTGDLLTVGVLEASPATLVLEAVVLVDVARAVAAGVDRDLQIVVDVPDDLVVRADPHRLEQLLANLLANAGQHGARRAVVDGTRSGDGVVLRVRDDGAGVDPEMVPRLFEHFATGRLGRDGERGTGLGLSIVRAIARAHDGDAWYEPTPTGACFGVRLPAPLAALAS